MELPNDAKQKQAEWSGTARLGIRSAKAGGLSRGRVSRCGWNCFLRESGVGAMLTRVAPASEQARCDW